MIQNPIHTLRTLTLFAVMAAGLWGCQQDDLTQPSSSAEGELQLTVTDGGYTTGNTLSYNNGTLREMPLTRATDKAYNTTFTAGDKIGLYAVKNNVLTATNVCLTLTNASWQGAKLPLGADHYFIYYPYQSSPGNVIPTVTTADAFFADIITAWTPATNQSGNAYTAQDLMVGSGKPGTTPTNGVYPLNVTLTHKMGLAVIILPDKVSPTFNSFTPRTIVLNKEYRYLVKPKPSTPTTLAGSFTNSSEMRVYTITANIDAGSCRVYNVQ